MIFEGKIQDSKTLWQQSLRMSRISTECIEQINCDKKISTQRAHIMKYPDEKRRMLCEDTDEQKYVLLAGMTGFVLGICSANL